MLGTSLTERDVLDLLKSCPPLAALSPVELETVARASREVICDPDQPLFSGAEGDGQMYVLEQGKVAVRVSLPKGGGRCGGQATAVIDRRGQAFGWSALTQEDRLVTQARCISRTCVLVVDLEELSPALRLKVFKRLAVYLYAVLQDLGLCPFNLKGLVRLSSESGN